MMTAETLTKQISNTIGKIKVLELILILTEQQFALHDLIDLTFYPDKNIAFRAAWILENLFLKDPAKFEAELKYLILKFKEVKHAGCQRHYAKIIIHLTSPRAAPAIKYKLALLNLEPVAEQCFDWMIEPKVKIAVKVFAAEALFNLSFRYPWIKEELSNQLTFMMRNGSPAIQSRGKKILSKL
jgi:hypothetical protein